MCIDCGKSNTNKEEVDKHIMCHTRGKTQLGCEHCEKAFTQQHTQILTCEKPKICNIVRNQSQEAQLSESML